MLLIKKNNTKKLKNIFLNKIITKKIIKIIKKSKKKNLIEIYSGNNYILKSIKKNFKTFKVISVELNKYIKKKYNIWKIIKINSNKTKNIKKKKYNLIILNPPYIKYKNINLKKIKKEPVNSLTNFKNVGGLIKKIIKNTKKILKKKSKIIIEFKNLKKWKK